MDITWSMGGLNLNLVETAGGVYHTGRIEKERGKDSVPLVAGVEGQEFCTSVFRCDGVLTEICEEKGIIEEITLSAQCPQWEAVERIRMTEDGKWFRTQRYHMLEDWEGWIAPCFELLRSDGAYTYPLQCYGVSPEQVECVRCDVSWAVPLPVHFYSFEDISMAYGVDRRTGRGTPNAFAGENGKRFLGVYLPDMTEQTTDNAAFVDSHRPDSQLFHKGEEWVVSEFLGAVQLHEGQLPLLEGEKIAAQVLLSQPPEMEPLEVLAERFAFYFTHNQLWEDNVFAPGRGWYRNMWTHTHGGVPKKDPYYDLGWGEGYGVLTLSALARYHQRKGAGFEKEIRQLTENMVYFLRDLQVPGGYYDRYVPEGVPSLLGRDVPGCRGDFLGLPKIWTHCLAQVGLQLVQLYQDLPDYPEQDLRNSWLKTAKDIAAFFFARRKENGDVQDGFDLEDQECNHKPHRIPARAALCGLWARMGEIEGKQDYVDAALALARAAAPEIRSYTFYNQMIDGHIGGDQDEVYDSENACYAFGGLVELYHVTRDPEVRELCLYCVSYFISWMYFFDLKKGYRGVTRGGTTCRMKDFPLVYLGAGGFAYHGLQLLSKLEQDPFYLQISHELMACVAAYQCQEETPWKYGAIHAMDQSHGLHWGPDREGQMDTGMTSGMALRNLEEEISRQKA